MDPSPDLLSSLAAPSAVCDGTGALLQCSEDFAAWMGAGELQRLGRRFVLRMPDRSVRELGFVPLHDGNFLVFLDEDRSCVRSLVGRVAVELGHVGHSLETTAGLGLLSGVDGPASDGLREALAASAELRRLREQLDALFPSEPAPRGAVSLRTMLLDVLRGGPSGWELVDGPNGVVMASAAQLFPVLSLVLERVLSQGRVSLAIQEGDSVRLSMRLQHLPSDPIPGVEALRGVLESQGGRLLMVDQTVILELPAWRASEPVPRAGQTTVLAVDDDDIVLSMIDVVLRREGFRVLLARNGVQASALLRQHPEIDVLVADAVLPGRSGLEVAEEARRQSLPVLMISGHDQHMLGISGVPLLQKPFGAKTLADAVEKMVEKD